MSELQKYSEISHKLFEGLKLYENRFLILAKNPNFWHFGNGQSQNLSLSLRYVYD